MNTLYPLKPNYKGKTKGWFVWLHHDTILEWSDNVKERTAYVRKEKPKNEQKVRAEHMIAVPDEMIPKYLEDAYQKREDAYQKLKDAYQKRRDADQKWEDARQKWRDAFQKWEDAHQKWRDADQKWEDANQKLEDARQKFSCSPKLRKFLKENTPYSWDEENKTLVY